MFLRQRVDLLQHELHMGTFIVGDGLPRLIQRPAVSAFDDGPVRGRRAFVAKDELPEEV